MAAPAWTREEFMAAALAREVRDGEQSAVGTISPIPASAVLLAHYTHAPRPRPIIINSEKWWPFRDGSKEFYDFAQKGRLDLFFLLDVVNAPGSTPPSVVRPGGPWKVITPLCVFRFDPAAKALRVESLHPGVSPEELRSKTDFPVEASSVTPITPAPTAEQLAVLRERVKPEVAKVYPVFARSAFLAA